MLPEPKTRRPHAHQYLQRHALAELQELHNVERQFCEALPRLAQSAKHAELKDAFSAHAAEATRDMERIAEILQRHGASPQEHVDQSMQALIRETEKWKDILANPTLDDAGLIASAQKILHYEIAGYGTITAYAGMLDRPEEKTALHDILGAKKALDMMLTALAKRTVNREAAVA